MARDLGECEYLQEHNNKNNNDSSSKDHFESNPKAL